MTTALDAEITLEIYNLVQDLGTNVTFRSWESNVPDTDNSDMDNLGSPTDRVVKVSPPSRRRIEVDSAGSAVRMEALQVILPTAFGLAAAITFVPTMTTEGVLMVVLLGAVLYSIVRVDPIHSGDDIAAYKVFLRE